jgi:hypothetical protein
MLRSKQRMILPLRVLGCKLWGELERLRRVDRLRQAQLEKDCIVGNIKHHAARVARRWQRLAK